jgi:gas vesicle protein
MSWFVGFGLGGTVAAVAVAVLVPQSSEQVRARLRNGYQYAIEEARKATETRRAELEARLSEMQGENV